MSMTDEEDRRAARDLEKEFARDRVAKLNVPAAVARIQLWLDLHPNELSVAEQIGSSPEFVSTDWAYPMYAVDRADLEAVLSAALKSGITSDTTQESAPEVSARDRMHIKFCRDTHCYIEGQAGPACLNMDHLLDLAEERAVRRGKKSD